MTADNQAPLPTGENGLATNGSTTNGHPRTKICVYCGAAAGSSPAHIEAARELGRVMAANNIDLGESHLSHTGQCRVEPLGSLSEPRAEVAEKVSRIAF